MAKIYKYICMEHTLIHGFLSPVPQPVIVGEEATILPMQYILFLSMLKENGYSSKRGPYPLMLFPYIQ